MCTPTCMCVTYKYEGYFLNLRVFLFLSTHRNHLSLQNGIAPLRGRGGVWGHSVACFMPTSSRISLKRLLKVICKHLDCSTPQTPPGLFFLPVTGAAVKSVPSCILLPYTFCCQSLPRSCCLPQHHSCASEGHLWKGWYPSWSLVLLQEGQAAREELPC